MDAEELQKDTLYIHNDLFFIVKKNMKYKTKIDAYNLSRLRIYEDIITGIKVENGIYVV